MKSYEIRSQFLNFFEQKGHSIVPSAPMVLKDDPTLMFINSGMAQFKEYFLGNATPKNNRLTDTQKCLRVSGKHNDLEDVGFDTYHHTMFEMLGNWSFGDYFKKEAIHWAWELLTEVYKIDKDILYVSVFEGNEKEGVPFDQEAYDIWKTLIAEDRIIKGDKKDNFWEMGDQGPCGPCSEIHVDIRSKEEKEKIPGVELVNADHPQVVEVWNIVFMEFNRRANGTLDKLEQKHIDTGMGFERLCMVLQGVQSNYDTDVFTPLIKKVEEITDCRYVNGKATEEEEKINIAIRVVVDHIRAVAFAIADGQLPSNSGAGYVIRRILRRAIRYGFTFLNTKEAFIFQLVDVLCEQMQDFFPEIKAQKQLVANVIKEEEKSFLRTLDQGLVLLEHEIKRNEGVFSGAKAFELYDTFGFPLDLTALILREKGLELNEAEFDAEMEKQKNRSRAASETSTDDWTEIDGLEVEEEGFVGYDAQESTSRVVRYRKVDSKKEGALYQIVLSKTPFYPEGGGQVGDKGYLQFGDEKISVLDTKKENNLIQHITKKLPVNITAEVFAKVDQKKQFDSACNHSATHLLHQALRTVLGTHVEQKGSLVSPNNLRFDFSHFSKVTDEELKQVEDFVNDRIAESLPLIERRAIAFDDAVAEGAMALFGEKYGDKVRAIKFGESMELCGGIHVSNTSAIWHFKIVSEGAVAAGVRRIEAITSAKAKAFLESKVEEINAVKSLFKNTSDLKKSVASLIEENAKLKKQVEELAKEKAKGLKANLVNEIEEVNGVKYLAKEIELDAAGAKDLAFELGKTANNLFIVFGSSVEGKAILTCYVSKELVAEKEINASNVVRELGKYIQGGGGGQPFFATAGGKKPAGIPDALNAAKKYL